MSRLFRSPEPAQRAHAPTAVVVEDEAPLRDELIDMLGQRWPALQIAGCASDGQQALDLVERERPDIVFLDIRIPGPDGLAVAERIAERCHVVFVTAHDEHAIEAFERGAVDYLLKPMTVERLDLTLRRLQRRLSREGAGEGTGADDDAAVPESRGTEGASGVVAAGRRPMRWLTAPSGAGTRFIAVDEVVYFQSDHKYTRIALAQGDYFVKRALKDLLEDLDPEQFWRIHRSTVVNVQEIEAMEPDLGGRLCMRMRSRRDLLPVADSFAARWRRL